VIEAIGRGIRASTLSHLFFKDNYSAAGKVVVLGEAVMITAQVKGSNKIKFGMNREGNYKKQLAINVMRWLSSPLDR
jgi:hypothetical protein